MSTACLPSSWSAGTVLSGWIRMLSPGPVAPTTELCSLQFWRCGSSRLRRWQTRCLQGPVLHRQLSSHCNFTGQKDKGPLWGLFQRGINSFRANHLPRASSPASVILGLEFEHYGKCKHADQSISSDKSKPASLLSFKKPFCHHCPRPISTLKPLLQPEPDSSHWVCWSLAYSICVASISSIGHRAWC